MSGNFLTIPGDDHITRRSRVLAALNFYATGSYQGSVGDNDVLHLSQQSTSECLQEVTEALNRPEILRKYIKFPHTQTERDSVARRFNSKFGFPGVIGCIDGTHVAIIKPRVDEEVYYNRKGYHSLNCLVSSSLTDLISAFDTKAQSHSELQKVTAFSGQFDKNHKPTFSKDEYGKPIPGSMTEFRGAEAQARVCTEMKELCEIINEYGKSPCKSLLPPELQNATKVISFGELFSIYTVISDKLVGILLRSRKHQLTYFEGEVLFQKRDDDVPIFLMQTMQEIRTYCDNRALQARRSVSPMPERN